MCGPEQQQHCMTTRCVPSVSAPPAPLFVFVLTTKPAILRVYIASNLYPLFPGHVLRHPRARVAVVRGTDVRSAHILPAVLHCGANSSIDFAGDQEQCRDGCTSRRRIEPS